MDTILAALLFFLILLISTILPAIVTGIILKVILRKKDIPYYIPFILAVIITLVPYFINGKSSIYLFNSDVPGLIINVIIYTVFINAGIKIYTNFVKGLKS